MTRAQPCIASIVLRDMREREWDAIGTLHKRLPSLPLAPVEREESRRRLLIAPSPAQLVRRLEFAGFVTAYSTVNTTSVPPRFV